MLCADARDAISARLDDEELPGEAAALDAHLDGCAGCRLYVDRAAHVTRLTRTRAVEPVPDLVAAVAAAAPPAPRRGGAGAVRLALGAVGIGQCALAVSGVVVAGGGGAAHVSHESAAWNLALGVGFLWVATGTVRRTSGLVALVGAFVGVLGVLSVLDLAGGRVDPARLATHLLVVAGFVLLLALQRIDRRGGGGGRVPHPSAHRARPAGEPDEPSGGLGLAPTAHHRAA